MNLSFNTLYCNVCGTAVSVGCGCAAQGATAQGANYCVQCGHVIYGEHEHNLCGFCLSVGQQDHCIYALCNNGEELARYDTLHEALAALRADYDKAQEFTLTDMCHLHVNVISPANGTWQIDMTLLTDLEREAYHADGAPTYYIYCDDYLSRMGQGWWGAQQALADVVAMLTHFKVNPVIKIWRGCDEQSKLQISRWLLDIIC